MKNNKAKSIVVLLIGLIFTFNVYAEGKPSNRQKVIDFEDEVVEGINKKPLDSFNQISEKDRKKKKPHLYKKRAGFKTEIQETLSSLRYD